MSALLTPLKQRIRAVARLCAKGLQRLSGGRISPDMITLTGLALHVPIALLIATNHWLWAAGLLVVFGLFDTLDGELARLQATASPRGMLLDASTDRMKEVLLYSGAAYSLASSSHPAWAAWAVAACGASLCVSYVKAKGEAAVASIKGSIPHAELNRMFGDGLMSFEIRMAVLVAGLLVDQLAVATAVIAVSAAGTAISRLVRISKRLS